MPYVEGGLAGPWEHIALERTWGRYLSDKEAQLLERAIDRRGRIAGDALDVGCETGRWSQQLAADGWSIRATEVSQHYLDVVRGRIPTAEVTLVAPDRADLPCPSAAVDLVVCFEVAPVMNSSWFPAEAARVLRPGGQLVGTFWNAASWRGALGRVNARLRNDRCWYTESYRSWSQRLTRSGFRLDYEIGLCWAPFSRGSDSPLVPAAVAAEERLGLQARLAWSPWIGFVASRQGRD